MPVYLGDFVESAKPISATTSLSRVVELFQNDPGANYYILVRDKRPAGLISRTIAFEFAVSAGADHQSKLAIGDLVSARALILKSSTTVREFIAKAGSKIDDVMSRGCIVVEGRRFKGVLSPAKFRNALMSASAEGSQEVAPARPSQPEPQEASAPLLGTLAHEIRTPLTAIMGLSDMLAVSGVRISCASHCPFERDA